MLSQGRHVSAVVPELFEGNAGALCVFIPTVECVFVFNKTAGRMEWQCEHLHQDHHLFSIPVRQPGLVWERRVNLRGTHCLPGERLRAASEVGPPRHPHQSKYFSAPTLTSIKISQQDRTAIDYPSHHPLFCCSDSWFWHGGWFWWHNAIICHCTNCCHVKILLPWKLSFMSHFLTRHKTLTDNFTQLWWKLLVSADWY